MLSVVICRELGCKHLKTHSTEKRDCVICEKSGQMPKYMNNCPSQLLRGINLKRCSKCGIEKDESKFSKDRTQKDGLCHKCKQCSSEYQKIYKKQYLEKNKACLTILNKDLYSINSAAFKIFHHDSYIPTREYVLQRVKTYFKNNKAARLKYGSQYSKSNKEYLKEYNKNIRLLKRGI
jgi:hypothetical protein